MKERIRLQQGRLAGADSRYRNEIDLALAALYRRRARLACLIRELEPLARSKHANTDAGSLKPLRLPAPGIWKQ